MSELISRRGLLSTGIVATVGIQAPFSAWSKARNAVPELARLDAVGKADLVRTGKMSALEIVDAAIARAEALQPRLNFLVTDAFDKARKRAAGAALKGPFAGVPFLVKDMNDVIGLPTRFGSRAMAHAPAATSQSPYVDAFDAAGLVTIGKSTLCEFALLPTTEPVATGITPNPWALSRSAGGSSGGAAAAVAAGVVSIAHASDGAGSIRIPASCCGLFGFKPSRGRLQPARPVAPNALVTAVDHCVSRTVRDSATLFGATEDINGSAKPVGRVDGPSKRRLRIGVLDQNMMGQKPHRPVVNAIFEAARLLEELGHHVESTTSPIDAGAFHRDFWTFLSFSVANMVAGIGRQIGRVPDESVMERYTLDLAAMGRDVSQEAFVIARERLRGLEVPYAHWLTHYDVVLGPVLGAPPAPHGFVAGTNPSSLLLERLDVYAGYCALQNIVGAPGMSVPLHWEGSLPVGVHLAAAVNDDRTLFELAFELEQARPWADRWPIL